MLAGTTTQNGASPETAAESAAPQTEDAADAGPARRCIASGMQLPVARMIRFVVGPDDRIVPDVDGRLPGRGLWLSASRDMIETATSKRLFAKAARQNVTVPVDLADTVADLLRRRCLNHLGLARRAGLVVAGAEKVKARIAAGRAAVLIEAADGSPQERRKFVAMAPDAPVVDAFTSAELGAALGRDAVVHAVLSPGRLASALIEETARYVGVRRAEPNVTIAPC